MTVPTPLHYDGQDLEALADLPRYYRWVLSFFRPYLSGRVVEVGAGIGNLAHHWTVTAREAVLVEPAPTLHPRLRSRFAASAHVRVVPGTLDVAARTPVADGGIQGMVFDAALLVNVLEHVPDDVGILKALRDAVRPGGYVLLFTPALPVLFGSLDRLVQHQRRYTAQSLESAVRAAGLAVVSVRYVDTLGVVPWFVMGRVLRVKSFSGTAAAVYDRLAVPVLAAVEQRFNPWFGKNLVCIARRTEGPLAETVPTGRGGPA